MMGLSQVWQSRFVVIFRLKLDIMTGIPTLSNQKDAKSVARGCILCILMNLDKYYSFFRRTVYCCDSGRPSYKMTGGCRWIGSRYSGSWSGCPDFLNCLSHPDSKVHGANMEPTWGRQDPGGPHVGPMNLAIWAHDCCACGHTWDIQSRVIEMSRSGLLAHSIIPGWSCQADLLYIYI